MKKMLSILLSVLFVCILLLAGCGTNASSGKQSMGLGVVASTASSVPATAEEEGDMASSVTAAAVLLDGEGKILNCVIDQVQADVMFDEQGQVTTPSDTQFTSKMDLGESYGMKQASSIGREWNEQAAAFADYVKGKTIDEVKGIALNEKGAPADADLAASVTVSVGGFLAAVEKAVAHAFEVDAGAEDSLGLNLASRVADAVNAGAEDGSIQTDTVIAAVALDGGGKITGAIIDDAQITLPITADGQFAADVNEDPQTKLELWDDYGMKAASSIGKEWHDQIGALCEFAVGKTADEVGGISVNAEGVTDDPDLSTSVTLHIGGFISALQAAADKAA